MRLPARWTATSPVPVPTGTDASSSKCVQAPKPWKSRWNAMNAAPSSAGSGNAPPSPPPLPARPSSSDATGPQQQQAPGTPQVSAARVAGGDVRFMLPKTIRQDLAARETPA